MNVFWGLRPAIDSTILYGLSRNVSVKFSFLTIPQPAARSRLEGQERASMERFFGVVVIFMPMIFYNYLSQLRHV